jgi:hypothetical protein
MKITNGMELEETVPLKEESLCIQSTQRQTNRMLINETSVQGLGLGVMYPLLETQFQ